MPIEPMPGILMRDIMGREVCFLRNDIRAINLQLVDIAGGNDEELRWEIEVIRMHTSQPEHQLYPYEKKAEAERDYEALRQFVQKGTVPDAK